MNVGRVDVMSPRKQSPSGNAEREPVRLQKYLAEAGIGSRRQCEEYIETGRVTVDGEEIRELGYRVDPRRQQVLLDGEPVRPQRKRYYLLNKPPGYLCTNRDPAGRPRAVDLVQHGAERLFTVGRLDENSQGLLLVTNDGEMANKLAHPRYRIPKVYRVQVVGKPNRETLAGLRRGMHFKEGKFRVQGVKRVGSKGNSTFLEIVLNEGRNREIRRLLARVGHKVIHLERVAIGPLKLGRLSPGQYRTLKPAEMKTLQKLVEQGEESNEAGREPGPRRRGRKPARRKR